MKVIFLGTPEFAVPSLKSIINSGIHKVVAVVTQPDRPVGRKNIITPPPVKVIANEYGIPVYQFEKIRRDGVEILKSIDADIMITCAYGQILSQEIIDIYKYGIINIHASLLPKYRGAAPIQFSVINGEKTTGITIMKTEAGLDTGDIIAQYETVINEGETSGELSERLALLGAEKINSVLSDIEQGKAIYTKQDESKATMVKMLKKEDALLDFNKNSKEIASFINGLNPWPVAYVHFNGKVIKLYKALTCDGNGKAGEVIRADSKLIIACGSGAVEILEIQEEGSKKMSSVAYLLGRKLKLGDILNND